MATFEQFTASTKATILYGEFDNFVFFYITAASPKCQWLNSFARTNPFLSTRGSCNWGCHSETYPAIKSDKISLIYNTHCCHWISLKFYTECILSSLPWIFPGAPLEVNRAPTNIQVNLTALRERAGQYHYHALYEFKRIRQLRDSTKFERSFGEIFYTVTSPDHTLVWKANMVSARATRAVIPAAIRTSSELYVEATVPSRTPSHTVWKKIKIPWNL